MFVLQLNDLNTSAWRGVMLPRGPARGEQQSEEISNSERKTEKKEKERERHEICEKAHRCKRIDSHLVRLAY
jgi:hypothetical protein